MGEPRVYTAPMRNYCPDCEDTLIDPIEFKWGYCLICLSIRLAKMDQALVDLYYEEQDGDAI